jgi:hypothetical protein
MLNVEFGRIVVKVPLQHSVFIIRNSTAVPDTLCNNLAVEGSCLIDNDLAMLPGAAHFCFFKPKRG